MLDYRVKLNNLLDEIHRRDGLSRYRIAKLSGITEQTLSNVMHGRRNLSITSLETLLSTIGYELTFVPIVETASTAAPDVIEAVASSTSITPMRD